MDFVKKNFGLLIFLIICVGAVIYLAIGIVGAQKLREGNKAKRQQHLDLLASIKKTGLRFDEENLAKATKNAEAAKRRYSSFMHELVEKQLLPGVDFTVDPDEEGADKSENSEEKAAKYARYSNLPYRKLFDNWMKGSLFDARETLTNELIKLNLIYFKLDDEEEEVGMMGNGKRAQAGQANEMAPNAAAKDEKAADKTNDNVDKAAAQDPKKLAEEKKAKEKAAERKVLEEKKAEMDAGKSTYQVEKENRMRMFKGDAIPEYFMFEEYVLNREKGLRNQKEKRNSFRQLILLDVIVRMLRNAEITTLDNIDFPCGLEIIDSDKYYSTPVSITVTGKPECVEAFLNLLNANENYIFYLKDIVSMNAAVQLNSDPLLAFNTTANGGAAELSNFLAAAETAANAAPGMGDRMLPRGAMERPMGDAGRRNRRERRDEMPMGDRRGGPGMMERGGRMPGMPGMPGMDGQMFNEEPVIRTRKAYRIFASDSKDENGNPGRREGRMDGPMIGDNNNVNKAAAENGTSVTLSLNFEFVEFKVAE